MSWRARCAIAFMISAFVLAVVVDVKVFAATTKPRAVAPMLPPVGDYPDAPCEDADTDGTNIYIGPTGDFWECICEHRTFGPPDCSWYNQGPITSSEKRKLKAKLRRATLPRGRVIDTKLWRVMPL